MTYYDTATADSFVSTGPQEESSENTAASERSIAKAPTKPGTTVKIVVSPAMGRRGALAGKFTARDENGKTLVSASSKPFLDAARVLLRNGTPRNVTLEMYHEGSPILSLRAPIIRAAKLNVFEGARDAPYFASWRPLSSMPSRRGKEETGETDLPVPGGQTNALVTAPHDKPLQSISAPLN